METYTNSEMTDMVFGYGSGVGLRAQAFYRKSFRRVVFRIRKHFWLLYS
jgi:hypothetical protein